jgi:RNA recognition motif-containing protein
MRPVFAGNLEYDTRQSDLERLFSKYGRIERVDMKSGIISCFTILMLGQKNSMFFVEFTCLIVICCCC